MSRAIRVSSRSVTFNLLAIQRKLEKGTLTAGERRIYKRVFGVEPEALRDPPAPPQMVEQIFFFPNGAIACMDAAGKQVPRWQVNVLCDWLRKMQRAGVITATTKIAANGRERLVSDWVGVDGITTTEDTASPHQPARDAGAAPRVEVKHVLSGGRPLCQLGVPDDLWLEVRGINSVNCPLCLRILTEAGDWTP